MARVKGPNGLPLTMPDDIARSLVKSPSGLYEYVKDEPKAEPKKSDSKSTTRKSSSEK